MCNLHRYQENNALMELTHDDTLQRTAHHMQVFCALKNNYTLMKTNLVNESSTRKWMVIYTRSKYEKKTDRLLNLQGIQSFCPLVKRRMKWADRVKTVEFPLFSSYIFVHVNLREHSQVLQTTGVINFVYYCGKPALVPSADIERVKYFITQYSDIESVSVRSFMPGDKVTINDGVLFDFHGEVLEVHGKTVLVIMKQLDCALVAKVKVSSEHLFPAREKNNLTVIN